MPLVDEIKKRVLSAMKAKNTVEKEVLRVSLQAAEAQSASQSQAAAAVGVIRWSASRSWFSAT